jgi:putative addiction module antidote
VYRHPDAEDEQLRPPSDDDALHAGIDWTLRRPLTDTPYDVGYNKGPSVHMLKLTQIGNSVGVILPKELLSRLRVEKGDTIYVTETSEGVLVTPYDPSVAAQVETGRQFMRDYRDAFHELAK